MFRKILFPTDFSDVAARALEFVKQLKDSGAEEVVLLNVLEEKYFYLSEEFPAIDLETLDQNLKIASEGDQECFGGIGGGNQKVKTTRAGGQKGIGSIVFERIGPSSLNLRRSSTSIFLFHDACCKCT